MAINEYDVLMQRKKDNGDIEIHYPITQTENVVGLENKLKHPIPTVNATFVKTEGGVDYYTATSDEITELYDKLIILLQLDKSNTGKINLKINDLPDAYLKRINANGNEIDFKASHLLKNSINQFQYNGSGFIIIENTSLNEALAHTNSAIDSLNENKLNKEAWVSFIPNISGGTIAGNFTYGTQYGRYKIFDDAIFFEFNMSITNFTSSGASGQLKLAMPAPAIGAIPYNPIVAIVSTAGFIGAVQICLNAAGTLVVLHNNGASLNTLQASSVISDTFVIYGSIWYRYK